MNRTRTSAKSNKGYSVEQSVGHLLAFMRRYLSHLCPLPFADMHREWDELSGPDYYRLNIQAHRESAKSTIWAVGLPLWRICMWLYLRNTLGQPEDDENIAILGVNDDEARGRLRQVRKELETNPLIRRDFNPRRGGMWTDSAFLIAGTRNVKDPTVQASGLTSFIPGSRLTVAILDDTTDKLHVESRAMRDKQQEALDEVVTPSVKDGGIIALIHTTYHNNDLPSRVAKDDRYHSQKWPLVTDEDRKIVQWPQAWPWRRVLEVKKKPLIYARQYQLKEVLAEDRLLAMPKYWNWMTMQHTGGVYLVSGKRLRMASGVDPAISEKELAKGSRTAIVTAGVMEDMTAHIVEARGGRWPIERSLAEMIDVHRQWGVNAMFIEKVAFSGVFQRLLSRETGVPARDSMAQGDKMARITGTLNVPMHNGKILWPEYGPRPPANIHQMPEAIQELVEYPGETLDFLDALEHLIRNVATHPVYATARTRNLVRDVRGQTRSTGSSWIRTKYD